MVTKAFAAIGVFGVLVSMAAVAWPAPGAQATINSAINFQGKLANANGTNIPNGTYNLEFKLYTAGAGCVGGGSSPCGGTLQWTEDWLRNSSQGVTVTDGIFQVNLGSITSLPAIFNNNTIWMSINLGNTNATCTPFTSCSGDGEMLPFVRFTASPYALNSDALQGLHATDFAQLSPGSAQSGFLNVNGNVTSGATVAAATGLQAPLVDTATAVALNVGTGIASSVNIGRTTTPFLVQGNSSSTFTATSGANTTTVSFAAPTAPRSIIFPDAGGTLCTTTASTCSATYQVASATGYLAKNATDTSSFAVTATNFLYGFTNSSSAVASGVLKLDNGNNTGSGLTVVGSGNPAAGQALILANGATGITGNLLDLQVNASSKFSVNQAGAVASGTINGQTITSAASFTGTVTAATSLIAPLVSTVDGVGASAALLVRSGNTSGGSGLSTGTVTIKSGDGTGTSTSTGNVTIDSGAKSAGGFAGNVYLGNTNAPSVNIGRNAATASGTSVSIQGLAASSNMVFNDATNTNLTTITVATPTAARSIIFPNAGGTLCLDSGNCDGTTGVGYILNQTGANQTANFQISGSGRANTSLLTPLLDTPSGTTTLAIGTTNATAGINLNQSTTILSGKSLTVAGGAVTQSGGAVSLSANAASSFTTSAGALTLTAAAASLWGTSAGDLGVYATANLNLGNQGGTAINIGTNAAAHTIAVGTDATNAQSITAGSTNSGSTVTSKAGALSETLSNTGDAIRTGTSSAGNTATALQIQNGQGAAVLGVGTNDTNLILNPGAEVAFGSEWAAYGTNTTVARNTSNAWNGAASVSVVVAPSTATRGAQNNLGAALSASTAYTVSFYAKLKTGDPAFADVAAAYSRDGTAGTETACSSYNTQTVVSGGWTRVTCTFTSSATAGNASAYIVIRQTAGAARTFYLDGVQLEQTSNVANAYGAGTLQVDTAVSSPIMLQNTENSTTALSVQNAAGVTQFAVDTLNSQATVSGQLNVVGTLQTNTITPTGTLTIGATGQQLTLQGNASTSLSATGGGFTTTLAFTGSPTGAVTYNLDRSVTTGSYLICTDAVGSCDSSTGYIRKGVEETDNVTVTTSGHSLLTLNNGGSGSTSVLTISNGSGLNSALSVTSAANLNAGNATIFASNTLNNATGNLLDLQSTQSATLASRFAVDMNGNATQSGGTSTTDTLNGQRISSAANFTGTVTEAGALTVSAGGAGITGNSSVTGTLGVTSVLSVTGTGAAELIVSGAPAVSNASSLVQIGGAAISSGSVNGTYIGLNTSGATTADLLNLQNNNNSEFKVTSAGVANATSGFSVGGTSGSSFGACGAGQYVSLFQASGGLVVGGSCTALPSTGGFLAKNQTATETSSGGVAGDFYDFTNTNSGSSANVLTLTNGGTGNALKVTSTLNPAAGNALIFASDTNAAPSGNLLDLQAGAAPTSRFAVDASGNLTMAGNIDSAVGISIGTGTATSVTLGKSTTTVKTNGTALIGNAAGSGALVNNGSTVNSVYTMADLSGGGWDAGGAAATVDIYTYIAAHQLTGSQTLTPPTPSASGTYGRIVYITNTGTTSFSILGSTVSAGSSATLVWANVNGVGTWTFAGADNNGIQNQSSADQTGSFRITLTGRANTSFTAPLFDTISASQLNLGTSTANAVSIGKTANTTTINGSTTVGTVASATLFKNNGATQNVVCAYTGVSGTITLTTAGKTVNDCTAFTITDTGATTISAIASPTAGAGSIIYINNLSASTNAITILGQTLVVGNSQMFVYDGTNWTNGGAVSTNLQGAYNNSSGAAPSILETAANKALTVQSAIASGMSAGQEIFGVRDAHTSDTLGNSIFSVSSYGLGVNVGGTAQNPALQSGIDLQLGMSADRIIAVADQTTVATAGAALTVRSAAGNTSGTGGNLILVGGAGGTSGVGGAASLKGGAAGGGNTAGGAVTVQGGASTGTGTGGMTTLAGGAASATGAGGFVVISAANGGSSAANGVGPGGNITLQAGSAAGSNDNDGGNITLTAGAKTGTNGIPGVVKIGSPVFTSVSETFTQTGNNQAFNSGTDPALLTNLNTYGTVVMNVAGAFTGATITMPSPTNAIAGRVVYVSAGSSSVAFTLAATGMSGVNMSSGNTATLVWNGTAWSGTTTASSLQQVYNNTSTAPASIITTSTTKNILFQAGVGDDNANVFQVGNSAAAPVISIDTTNTATGFNLASNGGVEVGGVTGWTAFTGTGSASITQNVTAANLASGIGSVDVAITGTGTGGANNALSATALTSSRLYAVSFNIKSSSGTPTIAVQYYKDATPTLDATCNVPTNGTVNSTGFFKYTCYFTTSASGQTTGNFLRISKTDASTIAHIYIDNLAVVAQNTTGTKNTGSLRVGGPLSQGLTLLTLDTFAAVPFTGTVNQDLYGSMYYDTTLGRIQCYEIDGWGSCGAAPDSNLILEPEYAGAVLNPGLGADTHIGTVTANICSGSSRMSIQATEGTICASTEEYNFYRWTTSQVTAQTYSIFVKYQLPPTFGGFASDSTIQMVGRVSSTTDASIAYAVFQNDGTECGGNPAGTTTVTTSNNTWQTVAYNGNEATTCTFAPNDIVTFRVDMSSKNNAYAYASQITFTMKGK